MYASVRVAIEVDYAPAVHGLVDGRGGHIRVAEPVLGDQPVIHAPRGMPLLARHTTVRLEPRIDRLHIRVDTRRACRARGRLRRAILHLRILLDGLPRTQPGGALISRHGTLLASRSLISCCIDNGFVILFLPESRWNLQFGKNTEVRAGPVPSSHRSDEADQN